VKRARARSFRSTKTINGRCGFAQYNRSFYVLRILKTSKRPPGKVAGHVARMPKLKVMVTGFGSRGMTMDLFSLVAVEPF
jgi:hypothetical protein